MRYRSNRHFAGLLGSIQRQATRKCFQAHLEPVHRALADGAPVTGYLAWSFIDNFEWAQGYRPRFGLVYNDFATQQRTIKESGYWYADHIRKNKEAHGGHGEKEDV